MENQHKRISGPYSFAEVFQSFDVRKSFVELEGTKVHITKTLRTFFYKGTQCASCDLNGSRFYVEEPKKRPLCITLYGVKDDGTEVYFTRDHIVPRALFGSDAFVNLQTMCSFCNQKKAARIKYPASQPMTVILPDGDKYDLPMGATPLDLAFRIHPALGLRCVGAEMDGQFVPLDKPLLPNSRVVVITKPEQKPSKTWLNAAVTKKAHIEIRKYFRQQST